MTPEEVAALFVVRLFDGFDFEWMDVSPPVCREEAERIWYEKTRGGTYKTRFDDIDYFRIFPANTVMHFSKEGREYLDQ